MRIWRRLFQRFQKRVRCLHIHPICIDDDAEFVAAFFRAFVELALGLAELLYGDGSRAGLRRNDVRIGLPGDFRRLTAEQMRCKLHREFARAAALGPGDQVGVREASVCARFRQECKCFVGSEGHSGLGCWPY